MMAPERVRICEHEAGHAVVAMHHGGIVTRVVVDEKHGNTTTYIGGTDEDQLTVIAAGIAVSGLADAGCWGDTLKILERLGLKDASSTEMGAALYPLIDAAREILERHADTHDALTEWLIEFGALDEGELAWFARRVEERNISRSG